MSYGVTGNTGVGSLSCAQGLRTLSVSPSRHMCAYCLARNRQHRMTCSRRHVNAQLHGCVCPAWVVLLRCSRLQACRALCNRLKPQHAVAFVVVLLVPTAPRHWPALVLSRPSPALVVGLLLPTWVDQGAAHLLLLQGWPGMSAAGCRLYHHSLMF